ncbi:iron-containing redox enzyme family protein [Methylobacillus caricis]|uniref:iron-containing redox enzyme family protein n=1 Tax=Methylobacillus caricis TaxID=1971611 RepID=UPI001CFF8311|nr:iron-containing redox enzyme family protein [Methylobacillus caricis]MCB5186788.1 iron-containing redox enzyme family protein [Methylobacillus caricis]
MEEIASSKSFGFGSVPKLLLLTERPAVVHRRSAYPLSSKREPEVAVSRQLYHALTQPVISAQAHIKAHQYLANCLQQAESMPGKLPASIPAIQTWLEQQGKQTVQGYRKYLQMRHEGGKRRYFTSKAHALHFLQAMAPRRMVEGACFYGFLKRWRDPQFAPLCKSYLKTVGNGDTSCNHVALYEQLLVSNECGNSNWRGLQNKYFVHGAISLALGHHADRYLPEIIGFSLGGELLSLDMLVVAYELNELEIKPPYFTLNATEGDAGLVCALTMLQSLLKEAVSEQEKTALLERVQKGYKLSQMGLKVSQIVANFDLQEELLFVMQSRVDCLEQAYKAECYECGRSEKLLPAPSVAILVMQLCSDGWATASSVEQTRIWLTLAQERKLPEGYELEILREWLAHDTNDRKRLIHLERNCPGRTAGIAGLDAHAFVGQEVHMLEQVSENSSQNEIMDCLINLMSPLMHHRQEGLKATRIYKAVLEKGSELYAEHHAFLMMRGVL